MRFIWLGALVMAFGGARSSPAQDARFDFVSLSVRIELSPPFGGAVESLKFEKHDQCRYRNEGTKARGDDVARPPGAFAHHVSPERLKRLNELLKKTQWLTAPGGDGPATHTHPTKITLTLEREGAERTLVCHGQRPEPYAALLRELLGVAAQERRIYLHDYVSGRAGSDAWDEVGRELAALRGEPYAENPLPIEYERYAPIAVRIVRNFYGQTDEELCTAIRLVGHLKIAAELAPLHKLAHDRSAKVRYEVAWALERIHSPNSLDVLASMMEAPSGRETGWRLIQWGEDAVPHIVRRIARSTDPKLEPRENTQGEEMVRAYLEHWDRVSQPIDPRVVEAVRAALAAKPAENGQIRTTYLTEFLQKLESRPATSKAP